MNLENWFMGIVEDDSDPLRAGRVKVRCFGYHTTDRKILDTPELPYMQTIHSVPDGPATDGNGRSPGQMVNSVVFGVFYDGDDKQDGIILGVLPGYSTAADSYSPSDERGFGVPVPKPQEGDLSIPSSRTPSLNNTRSITTPAKPADRSPFNSREGEYPDGGGNTATGGGLPRAVPTTRSIGSPATPTTRSIGSTATPTTRSIESTATGGGNTTNTAIPAKINTSSTDVGNSFAQDAVSVKVNLQRNRQNESVVPVQVGNTQYGISYKTRDKLADDSSPLGARKASLDYNAGGGSRAEIIIPNPPIPGSPNYTANKKIWDFEKKQAQAYVDQVTALMRANGFEYTTPNVFTTAENRARKGTQGGVGGYFHTEPAFVDDRVNGTGPIELLRDRPELHAEILANTLGQVPGVTFIAPHKSNDFGAGRKGYLQETPFAQEYTIPALELERSELPISEISQLVINQGIYENESEHPISEDGSIIQTAEEFHEWATTRGVSGITVNVGSNHNIQNGTILINKSMFGASPEIQVGSFVANPEVFSRWTAAAWGAWNSYNLGATGKTPLGGLPETEIPGPAESSEKPNYIGPAL